MFNEEKENAKDYIKQIARSKIDWFFPSVISNKFNLTTKEVSELLGILEHEGIIRHSFLLMNEENPSERRFFENRAEYLELLNQEFDEFDPENPIYLEENMIYMIFSGTDEYKKYENEKIEASRKKEKK